MEAKFTRGTWTSDGSLVWVGTEVGLRVLLADVDGSNHEQAKSNAALIAAAPDLFSALSGLLANDSTCFGGAKAWQERVDAGIAALKKARGE